MQCIVCNYTSNAHVMAVAQWRQMPHFWNASVTFWKQIKSFCFQNLSKFTHFASLYSDPAYAVHVLIFNEFRKVWRYRWSFGSLILHTGTRVHFVILHINFTWTYYLYDVIRQCLCRQIYSTLLRVWFFTQIHPKYTMQSYLLY